MRAESRVTTDCRSVCSFRSWLETFDKIKICSWSHFGSYSTMDSAIMHQTWKRDNPELL